VIDSPTKVRVRARLAEVRRRLGPLLTARAEPYTQNDAEITRSLVEVVEVLDRLIDEHTR
jgi:hypothetical protein